MLKNINEQVERLKQFWLINSRRNHRLTFQNRRAVISNKHCLICRAGVPDANELLLVEKMAFGGKTPWKLRHFTEELARKNRTLFLVVRYDDQVIGYIGARFKRNYSVVHITNLAVVPQYWRQGVATKLLATMLQTAQAHGSKYAQLEVSAANSAAQALYRHFGFNKDQVKANYYPETKQAGWLMRAALPFAHESGE